MTPERTQKAIFLFWLPLAATWIMMSVEGPFLAAIIARLPEPRFNLAAYGVAFAFALLIEAPVIMIMSASVALAEDLLSFKRLRNFTFAMNGTVTGVLLLLLVPPVFRAIMLDLISLPQEVASLAYVSLWLLLPWPAAIGHRRVYQGLLIRGGRTRLVAVGTMVRLFTMAPTGIILFMWGRIPGAWVGAAALSLGVTTEAIASHLMARRSIRELPNRLDSSEERENDEKRGNEKSRSRKSGMGLGNGAGKTLGELTYRKIFVFYYPLALTSIIGLASQPMMTFFMGRAAFPIESLAVFPVVASLNFLFRSIGLSFHEVAITLIGPRFEHFRSLSRFALVLGLLSSGGLALVAFTPLANIWFVTVSGLSPELARFAILPTALLVPIPITAVLISFQRAILVNIRQTRSISVATALEVGGMALFFPLLGWKMGMVGVTAAAIAILVGRVASIGFLMRPCREALKGRIRLDSPEG